MSLSEVGDYSPRYVPKPETFWTESKVALLRKLAGEGVRGKDLQRRMGCNGSMIYSKLERLNIKLGMHSARPRRMARGAFSFNTQTMSGPIGPGIMELAAEPSDAAVLLVDLDAGRCRWPISGAGREMMFCGERQDKEKCGPYCVRHMLKAYKPRRTV